MPRVVGAAAELLAPRVARYLFVSSVSVYADASRAGLDEDAPTARLDDPATEEVPKNYGALKAACEAAVDARFGNRATHVRPGLIVGPFDSTDRFGYWVARFAHPHLLGDRGPQAVVPAPPARRSRSSTRVISRAGCSISLERDVGGTFNAVSPPRRWTMGDWSTR